MPGPNATVRNKVTGEFYLARRLFPGDQNYVDTERTDPSLTDPDRPGQPDCHLEVRPAYVAGVEWTPVGDGEFGRTYAAVDHGSAQNLKLALSDIPPVEEVEPVEQAEQTEQVEPVEQVESPEPDESTESDESTEEAEATEQAEQTEPEPAPPKKKRTLRIRRSRKARQADKPPESDEPAEQTEPSEDVETA